MTRDNALGLYAEGEALDLSTAVDTIRTDDSPHEIEARIQAKIFNDI
jgi:hypothetical protein